MHGQIESTCCDPTIALVQARRQDATCPACGESYLADLSATVPRPAGQRADARVQVATEERLRPSSTAPVARLTHAEDDELVRVRRLLCELRPDRGGPLGWAADGAPPAAGGSAWTPTLRVQTSVEVPAILPGAFAAQARESTAPRLDPTTTLGWLQREGTLAKGLRALYVDCAKACATTAAWAKLEALPGQAQYAAKAVHGRKLVLTAMAEWWRETPPVDPEVAAAEAQALRSAQIAEVAGMVARQTERASAETTEALGAARVRAGLRDEAMITALRAAVAARGAHYTGDSFYGLMHETAHAIDLKLPRADFPSINAALMQHSEAGRMVAEVVAHCVARCICKRVGFPLFDDSIGYSARSTLKFAASRGESVGWGEDEFRRASFAMDQSHCVARIVGVLWDEALARVRGRVSVVTEGASE